MKEITITIPDGFEFDKETISVVPIKDNTEYIDLGLPSGTLWATCNIGAGKPEEPGDCFTFDEAQKYNCPSKVQFNELKNECSWVWGYTNLVRGYMITGKNKNNIFLPAAGYYDGPCLIHEGSFGYYWSNIIATDFNPILYAWYLRFSSNCNYMCNDYRSYSLSVRSIKNKL